VRAAVIAALVCVTSVIALTAQSSAPATQRVRGRIVADESGQPLANVRVVVRGTSITTRTDLEGSFSVVAPANATLVVTKAAYVRTQITSADLTRSAAPAGASPREIRLTRSAAIAGRITNERGEPIPDVTVTVATRETLDSLPRSVPTATTDDRGEYRIGGLAPGAYVVFVRSSGINITTSNARSGGQLTRFTGYFPDASNAADATAVSVKAGDEQQGIDFRVPAVNTMPADGSIEVMRRMAEAGLREANGETGRAIVRGHIVASDGQQLASALVGILRGGPNLLMRSTTADASGAYEFTDLPGGAYQLTASLRGYSMPIDPAWGSAAVGPEVTVADGEDRGSADVTMLRFGTISGRILDEVGEPVQGAQVGLMVARYQDGRRRLVDGRAQARITDDRGAFRIFNVPVGQYVVVASVGGVLLADSPGYATTYFPGTGAAATAQFVGVRPGEDVGGIDVPLVAAGTASIRGRIVDVAGKPWGTMFVLVPRSPMNTRIGARIEPDGTFEFPNLAPGRYVIQADRGRQGSSVEGEFLAREVTVGGTDVSNLQLQTSRGSRIAGHVVFESTTNARPPAPASVQLTPVPIDFDLAPKGIAITNANALGEFELGGISGARRLQVLEPPGWTVKAILSNGRNIVDDVLQFGRAEQSLNDIEVVLSDRVNELVGVVTDARGRRIDSTRAQVMAFSIDREQWYPKSRIVRSVTKLVQGSYSLKGLPTGSYYIAALLDAPTGEQWTDPAFLESLRNTAKVVVVGEGQQQTLNLQLPR
jgi:protocatechuate 3,4-dioxygenase beta subunit